MSRPALYKAAPHQWRLIEWMSVRQTTLHQIRRASATIKLRSGTNTKPGSWRFRYQEIRTTLGPNAYTPGRTIGSSPTVPVDRLFGADSNRGNTG